MIRNGTLNKAGAKKLNYYDPIPRTSDLLKKNSCGDDDLIISNYYIAPATVRFDDLVEEIIYHLNLKLTKHIRLPKGEDIATKSIEEIINKYSKPGTTGEIQQWLESNGHTGNLSKVASKFNHSALAQITRAILSEEGIFLYLSYKAVEGHDIKDTAGIGANVLNSLGLVKSYININLVDKVVEKENLNVSEKEKDKLKKMVENRSMCYLPGDPVKSIVGLIEELKNGGDWFDKVDEFLKGEKVKLPKGTDVAALNKKMIKYLLVKGIKLPDSDPSIPAPIPDPKPDHTPEDFTVIENVGPDTDKMLKKYGIYTYAQLAQFKDRSAILKAFPDFPTAIRWDTIIKQAQLIYNGKWKELIAYQDELNRR